MYLYYVYSDHIVCSFHLERLVSDRRWSIDVKSLRSINPHDEERNCNLKYICHFIAWFFTFFCIYISIKTILKNDLNMIIGSGEFYTVIFHGSLMN